MEERSMSGQSGSGVPTKIVVGTDGSATAERAVHKATALAKAVGAELIIISAYNNRAPAATPAGAGISIDSSWVAAAQTAAETVARDAAEQAKSDGVTSVSYNAVAGEPSEALVQATQDQGADLLVVGSKGMQSTARFLLGPIANKVSRKVDCDLLIVETSE
jgi:nucleotide-binding universal stress UspA family protein